MSRCFFLLMLFLAMSSCSRDDDDRMFSEQLSEDTGIDFANMVAENGENNVLNYPYYFNGGGVAIGDINNDGLPDIYFSGNIVPNKLYLNKGNFEFEDITDKAGVSVAEGWKTGVTMADVNADGLLDIYVCRSAMGDSVLRENLLFINEGNAKFSEQAKAYGVADNSYSTHAAFFDYDKDNDLDLFVLNHSLPQYAGFSNLLRSYKHERGTKFQSRLYQNHEGKFVDVSASAGIINNVLSFGLGLAVSDLDGDGWQDIYISNDFNEEDYLYINNRDGTFREAIRDATGHVSLFSMGSDIADVNNDALPDIYTLDMLPESNDRIKMSSGDDNYDKYQMLVRSGFHHQSMRNMLHLNNGDGTFSEVGQLMGISNTDWSWATLINDFNGDGLKDIFVSNGYEKDYTNMQFLKFTVDEKMKSQQTGRPMDLEQILKQIPSINAGNYLFRNDGDLEFKNVTDEWGLGRKFKSNGAAAADLDGDGDPDLVTNAMNEKAVVLRNNTVEKEEGRFITIDLAKENKGKQIIGTKILVQNGDTTQYFEFSPSRGFQSSMYVPTPVGIKNSLEVDRVTIHWPSGAIGIIENVKAGQSLTPSLSDTEHNLNAVAEADPLFTEGDSTKWTHQPQIRNDFKKQFLLPRLYSVTGPRLAKGDVNGDGMMDFYACGPEGQAGLLVLWTGRDFRYGNSAAFDKDKSQQDEDATFADVDGDGDSDLYVVSGGYAIQESSSLHQDRLYLNDGKGNFSRANSLPVETNAGSCVTSLDFEGDGDVDLFVGGKMIPGKYPLAASSMLLINDGKGNYTNQISSLAPSLEKAGMIADAVTADLNQDGRDDLIVAGEWMPIKVLINASNGFIEATDEWINLPSSGWWNKLLCSDFDGDGDIDLVAGNYGLNNQYNVSKDAPATLVYKDFDKDGQVDPFFCYFIRGKSYPYASRDEALGQVSFLKARFPDYNSYSDATLETMFTAAEMEGAVTLKALEHRSYYFENVGGSFKATPLPIQAQFSPIHAMVAADIDHDGDKDLITGGNESHVRVRIGKTDANKGFVFENDGKGNFSFVPPAETGITLDGDVRCLEYFGSGSRDVLIASQISEPLRSFIVEDKSKLYSRK